MAAPSPEAMKSRILSHMNADHATSLRLFARHYSHLPLSHAKTITLSDITPTHLILSTSFGRTLIPFDPPLNSLSDARERLVAMHEECLHALGVDGYMLDEYRLPNRWYQWTIMVVCGWCFATFPFRGLIRPASGSWVSRVWSVGGLAPGLAELSWKMAPLVLGLMVVVHAAEAVHMARTRMRRYEVEMFSAVWWCWVMDAFVEGFGSFVRVDEVVSERKGVKERPKGLEKGNH